MYRLASCGELCSQRFGLILCLIAVGVLTLFVYAQLRKNTRQNKTRPSEVRFSKRPKMLRRSKAIALISGAFALTTGVLSLYGGGVLVAQLVKDAPTSNESSIVQVSDQDVSNKDTTVKFYPSTSFHTQYESTSYPKKTARIVASGDVVELPRISQALTTRDLSTVQPLEEIQPLEEREPKSLPKVGRKDWERELFLPIGSVPYSEFVRDRIAFSPELIVRSLNFVATDLRSNATVPKIIQVGAEEAKDSSRKEELSFNDGDRNEVRRAAYYKALRSFVVLYGQDFLASVGCGFLVQYNHKPYILTNQHVISDLKAKTNAVINIVLPDSAVINPVSIIECQEFDVAVLALDENEPLEEHSLYPCEIGDCYELRLFDEIMTIGAPSNLPYSPAIGYVSYSCRDYEQLAQSKDLGAENTLAELIQIDVTVKPGNSGGPVVNLDGQVVAMTTARMGSSNGLALPINNVIRIARMLIDNGRWIPTQIKGFTEKCFVDVNESIRGYRKSRVVVHRASSLPGGNDGSALQVGDEIVKFNGFDVPNRLSLLRLIALSDPTKKVSVEVIRNSQQMIIEVELTGGRTL